MPQVIDGEQFLTGEEAAALLGVKKATLYSYVSRGVLASHRQAVGRRRLYRQADVQALAAIQPEAAPNAAFAPHDNVLRDVSLPYVENWAGDH